MIIEDITEQSEYRHLLIIKLDHCLADGVSLMNFICGVADNYTPAFFPYTISKSISIFHKISVYLFLPFYLLYTTNRSFFLLKPIYNIFKSSEKFLASHKLH